MKAPNSACLKMYPSLSGTWLYKHIHSSMNHNNRNIKTTQKSINWIWSSKRDSHMEQYVATREKKQRSTAQTQWPCRAWNHLRETYTSSKSIETGSRWIHCQDPGMSRWGRCRVTTNRLKFSSGVIKPFHNYNMGMLTQFCKHIRYHWVWYFI